MPLAKFIRFRRSDWTMFLHNAFCLTHEVGFTHKSDDPEAFDMWTFEGKFLMCDLENNMHRPSYTRGGSEKKRCRDLEWCVKKAAITGPQNHHEWFKMRSSHGKFVDFCVDQWDKKKEKYLVSWLRNLQELFTLSPSSFFMAADSKS